MAIDSVFVLRLSCSFLLPLQESARSAGGSDQFLSLTASALGPRAGEILCVPFKSEVFIFHSPLALPQSESH